MQYYTILYCMHDLQCNAFTCCQSKSPSAGLPRRSPEPPKRKKKELSDTMSLWPACVWFGDRGAWGGGSGGDCGVNEAEILVAVECAFATRSLWPACASGAKCDDTLFTAGPRALRDERVAGRNRGDDSPSLPLLFSPKRKKKELSETMSLWPVGGSETEVIGAVGVAVGGRGVKRPRGE